MPLPTPSGDESQSEFMSRCVSEAMDGDMEQDQAVAACLSQWSDSQKSAKTTVVSQKTTSAPPPGDDPLEFVMSDETVDRMGDVIEANGWDLSNFRKNPVALFNHDSRFVIGNWRDVGVTAGELRGRLKLLPPVSDRLKEIHSAIQAGVLRAVSVGFRSQDAVPLEGSKSGGLRFTKSELVECSLVAVPANPNALSVAKSLHLSPATRALIFGELAGKDRTTRRAISGELAGTRQARTTRMNLSERIQHAQTEIAGLRDNLTDHVNGLADDPDDEALTVTEGLNQRIADAERKLEGLKKTETTLALKSEIVVPSSTTTGREPRPFAMPKKDMSPGDFLVRAVTAGMIAHHQGRRSVIDVIRERYGEDAIAHNSPVRVLAELLVTRAATNPATTTTVTWAAELVQIAYGEWFDPLYPGAIYAPLATKGMRLDLGRFGTIQLPTRQSTPTISGSFVAEGAPIPVRQGALTTVTFGLKKMAVITTFTREIMEHSNPTIETVVRDMIQADTQVTIDSTLIDANPATTVRPAGLRSGVAATTATAGGGFNALVGDIKALIGVLAGANSLRTPVWLMNPVQQVSISLTQNNAGDFPFKAEINNEMLMGYPVIVSTTMPLGMIILLDAADFVSLAGDDPRFDLSDQTVLHMEDTTPLPIATPGAPPTVAAPARSMFQTDSIALRMILPMNWGMRRAGVIAWTQSVTW
jgi:HK97 family phage prohead protease